MKPAKLLKFVLILQMSGHTSYGIASVLIDSTKLTIKQLLADLFTAQHKAIGAALTGKRYNAKDVLFIEAVIKQVREQSGS